ncbi:MAG: Rpn family recombination-promoting nuclease/putative transposase [Candidatus Aminicenantes bacterium]|jgi:predicted transposase/invertase (TIGR01784 family)
MMSSENNKPTHIRFDWAIKKLLRSKANFGILEGFLSELLHEDIKIMEILESEGNKETEDDKFNRVDILVKDTKDQLIIIEIQNTRELDYFFKILYNTSKATIEHIKEGAPYSKVKKVITVSVVYFDLGQGQDYVYYGDTIFEGVHHKDRLELSAAQKRLFARESVSKIFPEHYILKVNMFNDIARDSLDEWIYFLKNSEIKDEFKAKGLAEAREKLRMINLSKKELRAYQRHLEDLHMAASLEEQFRFEQAQAWEQGEKTGIKKTALNMINHGMSIDDVVKITGLNSEDIKEIMETNEI